MYLPLVILTFGVMLVCSLDARGNLLGIIFAIGSAIIFVAQNIVAKKIFIRNSEQKSKNRLDKLNMLLYSSSMAFIIMIPIQLYHEGFIWSVFSSAQVTPNINLSHSAAAVVADHQFLQLIVYNGTTHFFQNLLAFALLGMVSPVTYSIASLFKRIFIIIVSLLWFRSPVTTTQVIGIALTFTGLYLYDKAKAKIDKADQALYFSLLPQYRGTDSKRMNVPLRSFDEN